MEQIARVSMGDTHTLSPLLLLQQQTLMSFAAHVLTHLLPESPDSRYCCCCYCLACLAPDLDCTGRERLTCLACNSSLSLCLGVKAEDKSLVSRSDSACMCLRFASASSLSVCLSVCLSLSSNLSCHSAVVPHLRSVSLSLSRLPVCPAASFRES